MRCADVLDIGREPRSVPLFPPPREPGPRRAAERGRAQARARARAARRGGGGGGGGGEAAFYEVAEIVERRTGATGLEFKVRWGGVDPSTGQAWAPTWIGAGQLSPALRRQLTGGRVRRAGKPTGGKADRKQLRLQAAATLKRRVEAEERRREAAAEARAERRMRRGPCEEAGVANSVH